MSSGQISKFASKIGVSGSSGDKKLAIIKHIKMSSRTETQVEHLMKNSVGFDGRTTSKIMNAGVNSSSAGSISKTDFSNLGSHAQSELIKQASHDQGLRDKIAKNLRQSQGERGDRSFLHKVDKVTEEFHEKMRAQSLQDRLKMEGSGIHSYGYQAKAGETNIHNVGTSAGGSVRADNYYGSGNADNYNKEGDDKANGTHHVAGFNNFAV